MVLNTQAQNPCLDYPTILGSDNLGIHTYTVYGNAIKPLHILGYNGNESTPCLCKDPSIRLEANNSTTYACGNALGPVYWGNIALTTPTNFSKYTQLKGTTFPIDLIGDLVIESARARDIIITDRFPGGRIRFGVTKTTAPSLPQYSVYTPDPINTFPEEPIMTMSEIGVGILNTDPTEALQIGGRFVVHIGGNNEYVSSNCYNDIIGNTLRLTNAYSAALKFRQDLGGTIELVTAGTGAKNTTIDFMETGGTLKGIAIRPVKYNNNVYGAIGLGTHVYKEYNPDPLIEEYRTRVQIRGFSNSSETNSLKVMNNGNSIGLLVRDDLSVGIGTGDPKSLLQIWQYMTCDYRNFRFNAYENSSTGGNVLNFDKNLASIQMGISYDGGYIYIDKNNAEDGSPVFTGFAVNEAMKGLKLKSNGNIGISEVDPGSRLVIKGATSDNNASALNVTDYNNNSLLFVRNDGNIGIGFNNPLQKLAVNGKVRIGTREVHSMSPYYNEYMLSVNGAIITDKVIVSSGEWADFVFNEDYKLMTIEDLANYINKNNKLPDIPNEKEVMENGLDLAKMNAKLLQKIEELTLYIIELKSENNLIKKQIETINNNGVK